MSPITPRPHQTTAIADCVQGFASADRGQLIMACGTGKTFTTMWIGEKMQADCILVLVPSLSLLSQTLTAWKKASARPFRALCVCSDKTVGYDAVKIDVSELPAQVTTDVAAVVAFMRQPGAAVVFATYQSSPVIAAAQQSGARIFDLAIADEAHRCAAAPDSAFATILDAHAIRANKRLFTTATPRIWAESGSNGDTESRIVASMDDAEQFGRVFHSLTFGQAIEQHLLSDYVVAIIGIREDQADQLPAYSASLNDAAANIGIAKCINKFKLRRMITFHSRIKDADNFAREGFANACAMLNPDERPTAICTQSISGNDPAATRQQRIDSLTNPGDDVQCSILSNARCLSEGVDVPALDAIAFVSPRGSHIDIVQAVGRAIRLSDRAEPSVIILPVLIPDGVDARQTVKSSPFQKAYDVINALKSHDSALAQSLLTARATGGGIAGTGKIIINLPEATTLPDNFASALEARLITSTTTYWDHGLAETKAYAAAHGHARVPSGYTSPSGHNTGTWVGTVRSAYNRGKLTPERIAALESLPGWVWSVYDAAFDAGFTEAKAYAAAHGHARVPSGYTSPSGHNTGTWVAKARKDYNRGKLTPERIAALESLPGWVWDVSDASDAAFDAGFTEAKAYAAAHGHARVPSGYTSPSGHNTGQWAANVRTTYKRGQLTPERIAALESLPGWVWGVYDEAFDAGLAEVKAYADTHGHARVPLSYTSPGGHNTGTWASKARKGYNRGKLTPERIAALESLPGWVWSVYDAAFDAGFTEVKAYADAHGHARVPYGYTSPSGHNTGTWVAKARKDYNRGKLTPERIAALESLPGWVWDAGQKKEDV